MSRRVQYLDELGSRGTHTGFYDPEAERHPLPTYPYHWAPRGLMTRRQLRASGLRPGGQQPVAQILWKHPTATGRTQRRVAFLYDTGNAKPKSEATPAQQAAISKALQARKTCPSCQQVKDYCIPLSRGECNDCADQAEGITRPGEHDEPWDIPARQPETEWEPQA